MAFRSGRRQRASLRFKTVENFVDYFFNRLQKKSDFPLAKHDAILVIGLSTYNSTQFPLCCLTIAASLPVSAWSLQIQSFPQVRVNAR
jgi:hypothetical protein